MKYTQPTLVWKGVMPAITTQFSLSGELDLKAFIKNLNAQVNAGASGIILGVSWRLYFKTNPQKQCLFILCS